MKKLSAAVLVILAAAAVRAEAPKTPAVGVYYFHGDIRCDTCRLLEKLTVQAIRDSFPAELEHGIVGLEVVNFMDEGNEHFVDDFGLDHQSVVVVEREGDAVVRWKKLDEIWDLYDRPARFAAYVAGETRLYLDDVPEVAP